MRVVQPSIPCNKTKYWKQFILKYAATSEAEDYAWFVAKAAVSADLPAKGQSDTCPRLSLTPSKQSRLYNAQNLFTGKDWTDGPKDKFNSVLNLTVIIIFPQTSHFSWEPPCPWMAWTKPSRQCISSCGLGVSSCKARMPFRKKRWDPNTDDPHG